MTDSVTRTLNEYRGREYLLRGEATPGFNNPEEFSVMVYYRDPDAEKRVQIARVDTTHGTTHFDQLYRRDEPKEPVDWDFWQAMHELQQNWRRYAESFENKNQSR